MAENLLEMTSEESKSPVAKYFEEGTALPRPEAVAAYSQGPIDPKLALSVEEAFRFAEPDYRHTLGYCVMEDGTGYCCMTTPMPEVTKEMVDWWAWWKNEEPLRYKTWYPGSHVATNALWISEDVGWGVQDIIHTARFNEKTFGADTTPLKNNPYFLAAFGGNGVNITRGTPIGTPPDTMCLLHQLYALPTGGLEYRSLFWLGVQNIGGKAVPFLFNGPIPLEQTRLMCMHAAIEMATLASKLPRLYREFGNL